MSLLALSGGFAGCLGLEKQNGADDAVFRKFASSLEPQTSLFRSSGEATAARMKALFPNPTTAKIDLNFLGVKATGADVVQAEDFLSDERPSTALAQLNLRMEISRLCGLTGADNAVFSTSNVLMAGETLPSDGVELLAFAAARNVWLYPYTVSSPEVQGLIAAYNEVLGAADSGAPSLLSAREAMGRKTVCMAAFLAPQFWMGNPGQWDPVRKLALELAWRIPTWEEYRQVMAGEVTLEAFAKKLQSEPNYMSAVLRWHQRRFSFAKMNHVSPGPNGQVDPSRPAFEYASIWSDNGPHEAPFYNHAMADGTNLKAVVVTTIHDSVNTVRLDHPMPCRSPAYIQAFDPVTSKIQFELYEGSAWKLLVAQVKNPNGPGKDCAGAATTLSEVWCEQNNIGGMPQLTIPGLTGAAALPKLSDITLPIMIQSAVPFTTAPQLTGIPGAVAGNYNVFEFQAPSRLKGTALGTHALYSFRVRRFGSDGNPQDGYSPIKLFWSGQTVYACNASDRMATTCSEVYPSVADLTIIPLSHSSGVGPTNRMTNGNYLKNIRCGVPNLDKISHAHEPGYTRDQGWPAGPPYNDLAFKIQANTKMQGFGNEQEYQAMVQIGEDTRDEPNNLIRDTVQNGRDYRLLLTADYTFARAPTELYYRIQGEWFGAYPPGDYLKPGDAGYMTSSLKRIYSSSFEPIPRGWYLNQYLKYPQGSLYSSPLTNGLNELPPRPMAGILTQAGFIGPMSPKVRSLAARVFLRLMCTLPSGIKLSKSSRALHERYIIPKERTKHLNEEQGCYGCHVHLDPLASALSLSFAAGGDVEAAAGNWKGELGFTPVASTGAGDRYYWGLQGTTQEEIQSEGAFLGHKVKGVQEVAKVLADSREFAQCTVTHTFKQLFGREPAFMDARLIEEVTDKFMDDYNFNDMVRELALSPSYLRDN